MRALVLVVALSVVGIVVASCSSTPACSAATCGTCCDSSGACVATVSASACGTAGNTCSACMSGFTCTAGACVRGTGGGTGGGSAGGGSGGGTSAGGGTGGSTGGGSAGGGAGGAGGAGGGSVTCGAAPTGFAPFQITFPPTCTVPTPCATAPAGTFFYTAACISQSEFQSFKTQIESQCGGGSVTIHGYDGGMQGYAVFNAGTVCRTVTGAVTVYATINGGCAVPLVCNNLNGTIMGNTVACAGDGGQCDCTATRAININNQAHFTAGGNTLQVTETSQTFETCLTGATMTTRELDAGSSTHEPGIATLTHQ